LLRKVIASVACLLFLFAQDSTQGRELQHRTTRTVIITKGSGGDASGSVLLRDRWSGATPDLINLSSRSVNDVEPTDYSCVLVIGQGAVRELARSELVSSKLSEKIVGLYSHVIDRDTLDVVRNLSRRVTLNQFFTQSQLSLVKLRNASGNDFLQSGRNRVWTAPLVIETASRSKIPVADGASSTLAATDSVIWLGGNYVDSAGGVRRLETKEILSALEHLQGVIKPGSSVAMMVSARLFDSAMDVGEKERRLAAIRAVFSRNVVTYYGGEKLISASPALRSHIRTAPGYSELMNLPWSEHTRHYASSDQFNLFVDLRREIQPFLLNPDDADQALYASDYMRGGRGGLTQALLDHGCDNGR
jgi:hypothetical protein